MRSGSDSSPRLLEWRRTASAQHNVETVAESPLGLGEREIERRDQTFARGIVRDAVDDGVKGNQRIFGEVHLGDQATDQRGTKQREMNVGRTPRVVMVAPGVCAGLDRQETVIAFGIGEDASRTKKIGIERRGMVVARVAVASG